MKTEKKVEKLKAIKELFVKDLARIQGGLAPVAADRKPRCPQLTTLACGEEANGCSGC